MRVQPKSDAMMYPELVALPGSPSVTAVKTAGSSFVSGGRRRAIDDGA